MFGKTILGGIATAGLLLAVPVAPVIASDSGDSTETKGTCSAGAVWELKAEEHDGGVAVQFEVKSGPAGETWEYSLSGPSGVFAEGSKVAGSRGKIEIEVLTSGSVSDVFTATATSASQVCDSTVGVIAEDSDDDQDDQDSQGGRNGRDDEDSQDGQESDDDVYDGSCSADSAVALTVIKAGKNRVARVSLDGARSGEKWRYTIRRGNKVVHKGTARTKGKKAMLKVTKKTRGKGRLSVSATRVGGQEDCSVDDDVTNDDSNDDANDS